MPRKSHRDRNAVARAVRHHRPRVNFPVTMHTTCVCVRVYVCVCLFARLTYDGCAFCPLPLPVCLFSFLSGCSSFTKMRLEESLLQPLPVFTPSLRSLRAVPSVIPFCFYYCSGFVLFFALELRFCLSPWIPVWRFRSPTVHAPDAERDD